MKIYPVYCKCGQLLEVNGQYRMLYCPACKKMVVPDKAMETRKQLVRV